MSRFQKPYTRWWPSLCSIGLVVCLVCAAIVAAQPKGAPKELKLGFVDFFSGAAAMFGVSGKNTAELLVDKWNKEGGIKGVPVKMVQVDENGGPDKQVTEYRRLVLDEKVDAIVGYTSSANCLAIAPLAEELQTLTVVHICGTRRLTEENKLKYVFRTSNHQVADSVMAARYVLAVALFLRGGLVSFGHALFYAVGAYTAGFAAKWFGVREALLLVPLGGLFGAAVAAVIGLFMARYRGVFFAMLNLAVSMILYTILLKFYWLTGGADGLRVQTPTLLGFVPPRDLIRLTSYYVALVVAGGMTYVVYRFLASPLGYYLKALADNEIRIEYSGESVQRVIYATYVLSGALGGLGGVLVAFTVGHIVPEYAFWTQSGEFVFVALLGGYGSVPGPLIGAIAFEFIRTYANKYAPYAWQMTLGIIMLLIILLQPGGLWAMYESVVARFSRRAEGVERA